MKAEYKLSLYVICFLLLGIGNFVTATSAYEVTVHLEDINSATTAPPGNFRWLDVANQPFSQFFRENYDYTQADVEVTYEIVGDSFQGTLAATNLKPNFAYQLKLSGIPGTTANERIGLAGRWWQEEWNGTQWASGQNLNDKGVSLRPVYPELNPNDVNYFARKDILYTGSGDPSPTGLLYKFTGYLVFDYFITDEDGDVTFSFEADSSYHVLWATNDSDVYDPPGVEEPDYRGHSNPTLDDGPVKQQTFDVELPSPTYSEDYAEKTVSVFGEWERLHVGEVFPNIGDDFVAQLFLTEESFHGSGGQYAGGWAAAMGGDIAYSALIIEAEDATIKTVGGSTFDGWCLWSDGMLGESVYVPEAETYDVIVRAHGSPLEGIWPDMALTVDDIAGETVTVDSAGYTDYVFQVDLTPGVYTIGISFLNDAYNPGVKDRNLYLDRFTIISPPGIDAPELAP